MSGKGLKCNAMKNSSDKESEMLYLKLHSNAYCLNFKSAVIRFMILDFRSENQVGTNPLRKSAIKT